MPCLDPVAIDIVYHGPGKDTEYRVSVSRKATVSAIEERCRSLDVEFTYGRIYFSLHPPSHATIKPLAKTTRVSTLCPNNRHLQLHMMMDLVPGSAIPPRNTRRVDEGLFRIKVDYLGYDGFVRRVDIAQCRFSTAVGELLGREELVGIGKDLDLYVAVARPSRVGFAYASDECTLDALEIDSIGYRLYAVARVDVKC